MINSMRFHFARQTTSKFVLALFAVINSTIVFFFATLLGSAQECEIGMFSCDYWDVYGRGEIQSDFFGEAGDVISLECFGISPHSYALRDYSCDAVMIGEGWSRTSDGYYLLEETTIHEFVLNYDLFGARTSGTPGCDEVQEFLNDCELENSYTDEGQVTVSITLIRQSNIETTISDSSASIAEAERLITEGYYDEGITILDDVISSNSDEFLAYYWRGYAQSSLGNVGNADQDLRAAIELDSTDPIVWEALFWNSFIGGDFEEAKGSIEVAMTLDESRFELWWNLGIIQMAMRDYESAVSSFTSLINAALLNASENDNDYYWRGLAYLANRDFQNALGDLSLASQNGPTVHLWQGIANIELGNTEEGNRQFEVAQDWLGAINIDRVRLERGRGLFYTVLRRDDQERARSSYSRAIAEENFFTMRYDMLYLQVMYDLTETARYQDMLTWYESQVEGLLDREVPAETVPPPSIDEEDELETPVETETVNTISLEEFCTTEDSQVEITIEVSAITIIDSVEAELLISNDGDEASIAFAIGLEIEEGIDLGEAAEFVQEWSDDAYDGNRFTDIDPISRTMDCGDSVALIFAGYESDFGRSRNLGVEIIKFALESNETVELDPDVNTVHFIGDQLDTPYDYQIEFVVKFADIANGK